MGSDAWVRWAAQPDNLRSLYKGFGMSRVVNHPLLLGFEDIERMLERIAKASGDGYPPYNIERVAPSDGESERIRIVLAVAGFSREQLEVFVEDNQLTIRGKQDSIEKERVFLHRGIAARQFERSFVLADGLTVLSAELDSGLLVIDIMRPEAVRRINKIEIRNRS